jgi:hypothetical protein
VPRAGAWALAACFLVCAFSWKASATGTDSTGALPVLRLSGFVKTDYWVDSRSVVASREDLFLLYPAPPLPDAGGNDIHADPVFNFSAITSRVALHVSGPTAFGAQTSGLVEADFSGVTNADINGLRLRHAWMKLDWERWELLLGQWWHPLFAPEVIPTVVSLNTGAPFQPFIRNPQVSLAFRHGRSRLQLAAIAQRDNASDGPRGTSPDYLREGLLPNLHLQWSWTDGRLTGGLAADVKRLRPRLVNDFDGIQTHDHLTTWAWMGYARYRHGSLDLKGKLIAGQNLSEHLMLGGYGEQLPETYGAGWAAPRYVPLNHLTAWANILYGDKVRYGLFGGWSRNLGARERINGPWYGRGHDIAWISRVAPSVTFSSGKVGLALELEVTTAAYGTPDARGKVRDTTPVTNARMLFTGMYFF